MHRVSAVLAAWAVVVVTGIGTASAGASPASSARGLGVMVPPQAHLGVGYALHPLALRVLGHDGSSAILAGTAPFGYSPAQIGHYLGLAGDGTGETVAITVPYHDGAAKADVNTFSQQYGLPLTCGSASPGTACFSFTQLAPSKPTQNDDWALVESLDVEWIHAIAPAASIVVVEAKNSTLKVLEKAIDTAAARSGVVAIANSWYGTEFGSESTYDSHCALTTAVCVFSTGDGGNGGSYPAYAPNVIAAGGTSLHLDSQGNVLSETAWSCSNNGDCKKNGGSGGGVSKFEPKPAYQNGVNSFAFRGTPDVSFDADPLTGVAVYDSAGYHGQFGWFQVGGTSVAAPAWAAIVAVADQLRAGVGKGVLSGKTFLAQTDLYAITSGLFDIVTGENGKCGSVCQANAGYDFVTGRGSPRPGIDTALKNAA